MGCTVPLSVRRVDALSSRLPCSCPLLPTATFQFPNGFRLDAEAVDASGKAHLLKSKRGDRGVMHLLGLSVRALGSVVHAQL